MSSPNLRAALTDLREKALRRYGKAGVREVGRAIRLMDTDHSGFIDAAELRRGLRDGMGVCVSDEDYADFVTAFDLNGDGRLSAEELIAGIRGPLPQRRRNVIEQAFRRLDRDGSGAVTIDDIRHLYDVSRHPDVLAGRLAADRALTAFLETFERGCDMVGNVDGAVTLEEFINYYTGVSAQVPDDTAFELLLIRSWGLDRAPPAASSASNGQPSHRYNANHGIPYDHSQRSPRKGKTEFAPDGTVLRTVHPLFQTSAMSYGATVADAIVETRHNRPGGFTKNAPPFSAGSSLNTAIAKPRVI